MHWSNKAPDICAHCPLSPPKLAVKSTVVPNIYLNTKKIAKHYNTSSDTKPCIKIIFLSCFHLIAVFCSSRFTATRSRAPLFQRVRAESDPLCRAELTVPTRKEKKRKKKRGIRDSSALPSLGLMPGGAPPPPRRLPVAGRQHRIVTRLHRAESAPRGPTFTTEPLELRTWH